MRRRSFLAAAAASSAVSLAFAPEREPIGIGFLGASYAHFAEKFRFLRESSEWRILGVTEADPVVRSGIEKAGVPLLSRAELLAHPKIEVIAVESPVRDHSADGKAVLEAGRHLHLEKPPATNLSAFEEIVRTAHEGNRLLQVGYMWRYHPGIDKALEAAREGWLGSVYLIRASISNELAPSRRAEWGEFAGGPMFDLGGHLIDPMTRLLGRARSVTVTLHHESPLNDNLHDNTLAVLEWDKAIGVVHASDLQPDSNRYRAFEVFGTNGCAVVNPIEPPALTVDLAKAAGPYQKGLQTVAMPSYRRFVDDFSDLAGAVRREHALRTTREEDLLVLEMLLRSSGMA